MPSNKWVSEKARLRTESNLTHTDAQRFRDGLSGLHSSRIFLHFGKRANWHIVVVIPPSKVAISVGIDQQSINQSINQPELADWGLQSEAYGDPTEFVKERQSKKKN